MRQTTEAWYDDLEDETANLTYMTTYDSASRVSSVSDGATTLSYAYSIFGNLTSQTQSLNGLADDVVFDYRYDAAGRKTSVSTKIGTTDDYINEYEYDALGRIVKLTQAGVTGGNTVAEKRVDFGYSDDGTSARIDRYADLAGTKHVAATDQAFDHLGRVSDITHRRADEVFADYDYTWDEASRITAIDMDFSAGATGTEYDDTATYAYDNTSQLTDADYLSQTDEDYSWDATGNQNNTGYSTGDHNRLSTDGTYNYTWDNEGNLIRQTHITSGEYVINTWDHRNRLAKVTNYSASDVATQIVEYAYDHQNRLYKRVLDSDGNGTLNTATLFVRCDDHIVMELERSDATAMTASDLKTRQLWHPTQIDHHLAQENISPAKTLWTLPDHLNTVRDVVEYIQATGAVNILNHITYDSFGDIVAQSDSGITLVSYYTGRYHDLATGNRYHRERWSRASIRIWLSEDPIGFQAGDVNLYRYVGNEPITGTDPLGLVRLVYLFEGFGGPSGISLPQAKDYLEPAIVAAGDVELHYTGAVFYGGIDAIAKRAMQPHLDPITGKCVYDTLVLVGYSYGGGRVDAVADELNDIVTTHSDPSLGTTQYIKRTSRIRVNLAFTVDPVPVGTIDTRPDPAGSYGMRAPGNVMAWINYYQRDFLDRSFGTYPVWKMIWGDSVAGATNTELSPHTFTRRIYKVWDYNWWTGQWKVVRRISYSKAHVQIPALNQVRNALTAAVRAVPTSRTSYGGSRDDVHDIFE